MAFLTTEQLYSSNRAAWGDPVIFTGMINYAGKFCLTFADEDVIPG